MENSSIVEFLLKRFRVVPCYAINVIHVVLMLIIVEKAKIENGNRQIPFTIKHYAVKLLRATISKENKCFQITNALNSYYVKSFYLLLKEVK